MLKILNKYWRVFWQFRKMHFMTVIERRMDFFFWGFVSLMWTIFNVFFFSLILGVTDTIGGWSVYEMYVLLGIFSIVDSFTWGVFYFNMTRYTNSIYDGELNSILLKPINPVYLLLTRYNNYNNVFRFFIGLGMTIWATAQLDYKPSLVDIGLSTIMIITGMLCIYFIWFTISTCAFYFEKLDNINEIIPNIRRVWQVPREVYPGFVGFILTYLMPMALVVSVPAEVLTGRYVMQFTVYLIVFTVAIMFISYHFFQYSVKKFSGVAN